MDPDFGPTGSQIQLFALKSIEIVDLNLTLVDRASEIMDPCLIFVNT